MRSDPPSSENSQEPRYEMDLASQIVESCPAGMIVFASNGRIICANAEASRILNITRQEILKRFYNAPDWHLTDYDGNPFPENELPFRRVLETRKPVQNLPLAVQEADGERKLLSLGAAPILGSSGEVTHVVMTLLDATERILTEKALLHSQECYRQLFESVNDALFLRPISPDGRIGTFTHVNRVACERLGYTREEMLQKTPFDVDLDVTPGKLRDHEKRLLAGEGVIFQTRQVAKDGRQIVSEISSHLFEWDGNKIMLSVARDLSDRQQMLKEIELSEQKFKNLFTHAPIGIYQSSPDHVTIVNPALARMCGFNTPEELLNSGKMVVDYFVHPEQRLEIIEKAMAVDGYALHEVEYFRKDGTTFIANLLMRAVKEPSGALGFFEGFVEDITERKRAEQERAALTRQMFLMFESAGEGIYGLDLSGRCTFMNQAAAKMFDCTPEMVLGKETHNLFHHHTATGSFYPAEECPICHVIKTGTPCRLDNEVFWRTDGTSFPVEYASHPIIEDGKISGAVVTFSETTKRRQLEEQLRQAQKMEAVGQLAGSIAHDFNNILAATLMHLAVLQRNPELTHFARESLREVEDETKRAANLTRQLLLFSRTQVARIEPLEVNKVIEELLKMLGRLLGVNIQVDFRPAASATWVKADAGMLEQVVMNFCLNARDAMDGKGRLCLSTELVDFKIQSPSNHPEARPGRFVKLTASDTGCGMSKAVLNRIFEPFFTTKEAGKGTGLGLATVYGIVKQHAGWIEVESVVGKGSSFHVYLPAQENAVARPRVSAHEDPIKGGTETILMVEDELGLRRMAALNLRKLGYAVFEATDGREALEVWDQHESKIDLLLTDVMLPGEISGLELARRLKAEKHTLRVITTSGYNVETAKSPGRNYPFLQKPFDASKLARIVRQSLDTR